MFPRLASLLMTALGTIGCADMLGLGGLTYDQGEETLVVGTGGAFDGTGGENFLVGDGDGDLAMGGVQIAPPPESFSIQLDRGAVLAASPFRSKFSEYFIFEPDSEQLSFRRQDAYVSALIETWRWPAPDGMSHLAVVPFADGVTLLGYNQTTGFTTQATLSAEWEFEVVFSDIQTSGRSQVLSFSTGEEWRAFVYSASDGTYRYFRPLPSDNPDVFAGAFETGWTSISGFVVGGEPGLLKHNSETGLLQFDRFVAQGEPLEKVLELQVDQTFSHMVTYSESVVVFYEAGSGSVLTGTIRTEEDLYEFQEGEQGYFRGDLTQIVPLLQIGQDYALTFSAASGQAVLRELAPLDDVNVVVVK